MSIRLPWKRLTRDEQERVARLAGEVGLLRAAEQCGVSVTAARRACALVGVVAIPHALADAARRAENPEQRVARAAALLRALRVRPEDLVGRVRF
jgi:hypothetical protein